MRESSGRCSDCDRARNACRWRSSESVNLTPDDARSAPTPPVTGEAVDWTSGRAELKVSSSTSGAAAAAKPGGRETFPEE